VHVHPEHELLPRDEAERAHKAAIAIIAHNTLILPAGEGVRPGRADLEPAPVRALARERASARSDTSSAPTVATSGQGVVAISSTDSSSSGLIWPEAGSSSTIDSTALVRSKESESRIMSSSSIPTV
jgi:hypothetical protein